MEAEQSTQIAPATGEASSTGGSKIKIIAIVVIAILLIAAIVFFIYSKTSGETSETGETSSEVLSGEEESLINQEAEVLEEDEEIDLGELI